ncbi:MAG: PHP domain-containing protein [Candidatus Thermoplasmatota archaeon]|jgi:hypothetical protein|nr:PHP domain-containing protein [Candidatus Thermoplasmatota archaeon]MDP7265473.1 PHP domain-containing protein [Candidatus Thermoplasmatota archaeon]
MKIDMHVHTKYSLDGKGEPRDFVEMAKKKGLSGIAITDHNEIRGALEAKEYSKDMDGFLVIVGEEISTTCGHILAYNIKEKIERDREPKEIVKEIRAQGGFAVVAHPDSIPSGISSKIVRTLDVTGIEALNGATVSHKNRGSKKLARELNLGMIGGSDSHRPKDIGVVYTVFEGSSLNLYDIQQHIRQKRSVPEGRSLPYYRLVGLVLKIFVKWLLRGGKKI